MKYPLWHLASISIQQGLCSTWIGQEQPLTKLTKWYSYIMNRRAHDDLGTAWFVTAHCLMPTVHCLESSSPWVWRKWHRKILSSIDLSRVAVLVFSVIKQLNLKNRVLPGSWLLGFDRQHQHLYNADQTFPSARKRITLPDLKSLINVVVISCGTVMVTSQSMHHYSFRSFFRLDANSKLDERNSRICPVQFKIKKTEENRNRGAYTAHTIKWRRRILTEMIFIKLSRIWKKQYHFHRRGLFVDFETKATMSTPAISQPNVLIKSCRPPSLKSNSIVATKAAEYCSRLKAHPWLVAKKVWRTKSLHNTAKTIVETYIVQRNRFQSQASLWEQVLGHSIKNNHIGLSIKDNHINWFVPRRSQWPCTTSRASIPGD